MYYILCIIAVIVAALVGSFLLTSMGLGGFLPSFIWGSVCGAIGSYKAISYYER